MIATRVRSSAASGGYTRQVWRGVCVCMDVCAYVRAYVSVDVVCLLMYALTYARAQYVRKYVCLC